MSEETPAYQPERAFVQARAGFELFGEPLRKFSFSRKIAAQQMGCVAPALGAGRDQMAATGVYPGALNDTIIVMWLCLQKDASEQTLEDFQAKAFTPERAINRPLEAIDRAREWAESKGIVGVMEKPFVEAYEVFLQIMFGIQASAFEVDTEKTGAPEREDRASPKETPARPSTRNPSRGSRRSAGTTRHSSGKK